MDSMRLFKQDCGNYCIAKYVKDENGEGYKFYDTSGQWFYKRFALRLNKQSAMHLLSFLRRKAGVDNYTRNGYGMFRPKRENNGFRSYS